MEIPPGPGNVGAVSGGQRAAARCARPIVHETLSHTPEELVDFDDVHEDVEQQLEALARVDRREVPGKAVRLGNCPGGSEAR
jgi:hypothetical protein